jgi:hypothetical protein
MTNGPLILLGIRGAKPEGEPGRGHTALCKIIFMWPWKCISPLYTHNAPPAVYKHNAPPAVYKLNAIMVKDKPPPSVCVTGLLIKWYLTPKLSHQHWCPLNLVFPLAAQV